MIIKVSKYFERVSIILIIILLFGGMNVLQSLGYMIGNDNAPAYQKLHPSFMLAVIFLFQINIVWGYNKKIYKENQASWHYILILVILLIHLILNNLTGNIAFIPNTLLLPGILSIILSILPKKSSSKLSIVVIFFYVSNNVLAIMERILSIHIFGSLVDNIDYSGFRATAFQNHPLNNALINAIIMIFILTSNYSSKHKLSLYFLGSIGIICFGSRSSLAISLISLAIYTIYFLITSSSKSTKAFINKFYYYLVLVLGLLISIILITQTQFGERLVNTAYFDDSAQVRLNSFNIFDVIDYDSLLWGSSNSYAEFARESANIYKIENFWIIWILRFGLIMSVIMSIFFVRYLIKSLVGYKSFNKVLIIGTFLLIASTNLSLASTTPAISIFILCAYIFVPKMQDRVTINTLNH